MRTIFTFLFAVVVLSSFGQNYSRVKVWTNREGLHNLELLGVAADHGQLHEDAWFISDFSAREIEIMRANAYQLEIVIDDVQTHYVLQNQGELIEKSAECPDDQQGISIPVNFNLGSMGGFYTYQEMLDELDEMATLYPNLITLKSPISSFLTHEGRPIYHVVISDNPTDDEGEPNVLYTAIHHAREPLSMTESIFYMWYLLENYATNDEVKFLVDNTRLFFVPCINPDGYIFNEVNFPNGGGMHRKNRRLVGTSNMGVDLNRNYSYQWGTTGISFDPDSDVYPGEFAFSEPETQAIKWLVENYGFQAALNAHSYGDLLLHPIGTDPNEYADHHEYFEDISTHMTEENRFLAQKATFLYPVSGGSDDYMYKENIGVGMKDTVFAMTPEVGPSFWPAITQIIPYSIKMLRTNLVLAHIPHVYYRVAESSPFILDQLSPTMLFDVKRLGLTDGAVDVSIEPLDFVVNAGSAQTFHLELGENQQGSIQIGLSNDLLPGDLVRFVCRVDNGSWVSRDTILKLYAPANLQYYEDASLMGNWTGSWSNTNLEFVSSPSSFTDSPFGTYPNNANSSYTFDQELNLTETPVAFVTYYAKWDIEAYYDKVQFQVSTNGGVDWVAQCGRFTVPGSGMAGGHQLLDEPLYEGIQSEWVHEEIDLTEYAGQTIQIRFQLRSNGNNRRDGFYFDDLRIYYDQTSSLEELNYDLQVFPNPATDEITVLIGENGQVQTSLVDLTGKIQLEEESTISDGRLRIPLTSLEAGVYVLRISKDAKHIATKRIVVIR
jgi:carboxypeptidase T